MKTVTIGRAPENSIVIRDPLVANYHLQIIQDDDNKFRLVNCDLSNDTFVNESRVYKEAHLNGNDVIRVGNTVLPWKSYFSATKAKTKTVTVAKPTVAEPANRRYISQPQTGNPVFIVQEKKRNGVGTAGFVLALLGLILCKAQGVNLILWLLGLILSIIGCFRKPRGLAIAGVVISFAVIILLIALIGVLAALLS
jgi:hypothetical protein